MIMPYSCFPTDYARSYPHPPASLVSHSLVTTASFQGFAREIAVLRYCRGLQKISRRLRRRGLWALVGTREAHRKWCPGWWTQMQHCLARTCRRPPSDLRVSVALCSAVLFLVLALTDLIVSLAGIADFNQLFKVDPRTAMCWSNVLRRTPGATLWQLSNPSAGARKLKQEFQALGVGGKTLWFSERATLSVSPQAIAITT